MSPVCSECNALFSGGDGTTCPACDVVLAPAPAVARRQGSSDARDMSGGQAPAAHPADSAPEASGPRPEHASQAATAARVWTVLVFAGAALVPLSSFLGVRGWTGEWLWIWRPSMLANVVFTAGTMAAFLASVWLARRILQPATALIAAVGIGLLLHWLVYEASWRLVLAADPAYVPFGIKAIFTGLGFVAWVGGVGLLVAALAGGVAALAVRLANGPVTAPEQSP